MNIDNLCTALLDALGDNDYNASTIFNYKGVIRRFKAFCANHQVTEYTPEFGQLYADDVISPKTGQFSKQRYFYQGRFIRLLNSFHNSGSFDFSVMKRGRIEPTDESHTAVYKSFIEFLESRYEKESTIRFYDYELLCLLQYAGEAGVHKTEDLTTSIVLAYLASVKQTRQRGVLCGLNLIFQFLERDDLLAAIKGIHAYRSKRIIPVLTDDEQIWLKKTLDSTAVSRKDAAIVTLGLSTGIRAVDMVNLRLSDINWNNETISFTQSKTGNPVSIPLTASVGNAIARYLVEERPTAPNDYLFVREIAPFTPLGGHSSCYVAVKRVFQCAGIAQDGRIWGTHMLRHNAASMMVRNGVPVETIAAVLGHSNTDATDIYITTDESRLQECVLPLADIFREVRA